MSSATFDILKTIDLLAALKTRLLAIDHPTAVGEKLFESVEYHEDKNLAEAMTDLIITKTRVCLIVPAGDRYDNQKEGRKIRSSRITSVDLVLADRAYTKGGQDASFGGEKNVGVVAMKELVLEALASSPQLAGLRWCALYPTDGAFISLSAQETKQLPGRQAYVLNYETPSGWIITPITAEWPALP